jgi:D-sedoheptulose 7-phosphate isomerase
MKFTTQNIIDDYLFQLKQCLDRLDRKKIDQIISLLMKAYGNNRTIFILGNGGSAANASHMACDLGKGTLQKHYDEQEKRFKVISLTDNVALLTAYGNDLAYDDIFVQQLRNLVRKNDIVIVISASGNSPNCIKAITYARKMQAITIGLLGFTTGGTLAAMVDMPLIIPSNQYGICEDMHLVVNHLITTCISKIKPIHDKKHDFA